MAKMKTEFDLLDRHERVSGHTLTIVETISDEPDIRIDFAGVFNPVFVRNKDIELLATNILKALGKWPVNKKKKQ